MHLGLPEQKTSADYWVFIKLIIKEGAGKLCVPIASEESALSLDNEFFIP